MLSCVVRPSFCTQHIHTSSSCCYYQCGNIFFFFSSSFCVPFSFIHSIRSFVRLSHFSSFSFATFQIRLSNSPDILMHRYKQKNPHSTQIHAHCTVAYRAVPSFTSKTPKIYIRWILCFVDCCSLGSKKIFSSSSAYYTSHSFSNCSVEHGI